MNIKDRVKYLLEEGYECDFLDFKLKQYPAKLNPDFIKDVMAMSNSQYDGDKFIIVGVNDRGDIIGIEKTEVLVDSAIYQEFLLNYVEPDITIDYFKHSYEGKILGILKIASSNNNKPYMLKKDIPSLKHGSCIIRKGSRNSSANRRDFDKFYNDKGNFEIGILNPILRAVNDKDGLGYLEVSIRNHSSLPVTIMGGTLFVMDNQNSTVSKHPVYGLDKYVGADFRVALNPMTERVGDLYLGFTSTDCLRLELDQYGTTDKELLFKLVLYDSLNNEYIVEQKKCVVIANGEFLWKVKKRIMNR